MPCLQQGTSFAGAAAHGVRRVVRMPCWRKGCRVLGKQAPLSKDRQPPGGAAKEARPRESVPHTQKEAP